MKQTCKLTDQQKIEIVEKYKTGCYNCADLGREYSVTRHSISSLLHRRNVFVVNDKAVTSRTYTLNEHYFDVIDDEHKAYWLGLLYSDGNNYPETNLIAIELQEPDLEILEKFNKDINSNRPIKYKNNSNRKIKGQPSYCLRINSKHMSNQLIRLGVVKAKSLILKFPTEDQVPSHLIRHFIRGMWDGDGNYNLQTSPRYSARASLITTKTVCEDIRNLLRKELSINATINISNKSSLNQITHLVRINKNHDFSKFVNWLYSDCSIYLDRKYQYIIDCENQLIEHGKILNRGIQI